MQNSFWLGAKALRRVGVPSFDMFLGDLYFFLFF